MKRFILTAIDITSQFSSADELASAIEELFEQEGIPYSYVDVGDDGSSGEEWIIISKTFGDWRNDNDRADELVKEHFNPYYMYMREVDANLRDYGLSEGSDSCVCKHTYLWYIQGERNI